MTDVVHLAAVSKVYGRGQGAVAALREVTVGFPRGGFTAVMGPSGSGKSTFLHCAAGLDTPSSGSVRLGGTELAGMNETRLTELRRRRVGFVFQAFNLISSLTVLENITLPLRLAGAKADEEWLTEIVGRVGLAGRTGHRPAQLSGGQQQRVAIARALVTRPEVVFGDEPTGALDTMTARDVLTLLREVVREMDQTVIMVTHDPVAASYADTVLFLADGRLVDSMAAPTVEKVADRMTRLGAWKR
ncbi:ABC transporter [Microtetraspora sp. NBRC 13810]|uniref:ABC transporter ATP-binding protein n=1 Tax=Microtetraspora sp. NBRC 13810 TaxID=3030990 RepID=UPI0024A04091|nr:ABC transporter ATP-binding protein [Microtetraspora sp. NBRC 13810]GLW07648.1 ABC transporter [Microtetraspora sp. NBRC 13810]